MFALVHADRSFAFVRDPHIWNCRSYIGIDLSDSVAARILTEAATGTETNKDKRARSLLVEKLNTSIRFFIHERGRERKNYRALFISLLKRKLKLSKLNHSFIIILFLRVLSHSIANVSFANLSCTIRRERHATLH